MKKLNNKNYILLAYFVLLFIILIIIVWININKANNSDIGSEESEDSIMETITENYHDFLTISMYDEQHGWATDYKNIYYTKNGIDQWYIVDDFNTVECINQVQFLNETTAYVMVTIEDSTVLMYKTMDSGITWVIMHLPNQYSGSMFYIDNKGNGWVLESKGATAGHIYNQLWFTKDDGETWLEMTSENNNLDFIVKQLFFIGEEGYVFGSSTGFPYCLYYTKDGTLFENIFNNALYKMKILPQVFNHDFELNESIISFDFILSKDNSTGVIAVSYCYENKYFIKLNLMNSEGIHELDTIQTENEIIDVHISFLDSKSGYIILKSSNDILLYCYENGEKLLIENINYYPSIELIDFYAINKGIILHNGKISDINLK